MKSNEPLQNSGSPGSLGRALRAIQEIVNDFSGEFALKNDKRQYFFVNDNWVKTTGMERKDVMGKIDAEVFPSGIAMQITGKDSEAIEKKLPVEYTQRIVFNGYPISSLVIKWAITYNSGELFCICTLSDRPENKNTIRKARKRIEALFENVA